MNDRIIMKVAIAAILLSSALAFGADGRVTISSPSEGAMVSSKDKVTLTYDAVLGPDGDHLHLNVDGRRVDIIRQLKGSAEVGPLDPGMHRICLAVNTKGHVPTGVEGCVNVSAK